MAVGAGPAELCVLGANGGEGDLTLVSGAYWCVCPRGFAEEYPLDAGAARPALHTASGKQLKAFGVRAVPSELCDVESTMCAVHCTIDAASRCTVQSSLHPDALCSRGCIQMHCAVEAACCAVARLHAVQSRGCTLFLYEWLLQPTLANIQPTLKPRLHN